MHLRVIKHPVKVAVVVAQLAEQLVTRPKDLGSNPDNGKILFKTLIYAYLNQPPAPMASSPHW